MSFESTKKICPVCEMVVTKDDIFHCFRGIDFWFCSEHCKTRFIKYSSVFVGDPQHGKSAKQQGARVIKMNKITLIEKPDTVIAGRVINNINQLMGVDFVEIEADQILVIYDLLQVSLEDIENATVLAFGKLSSSITERIKRTIIHYNEECELGNIGLLVNNQQCH